MKQGKPKGGKRSEATSRLGQATRIKRTQYAQFHFISSDWSEFVPSDVRVKSLGNKVVGFSGLTNVLINFDTEKLMAFAELSSIEWISVYGLLRSGIGEKTISQLVEKGFAYFDDVSEWSVFLRSKEELITNTGWKSSSYMCHVANMWQDMSQSLGDYGRLDAFDEFLPNEKDPRSILPALCPAPPALYRREDALSRVQLKSETTQGHLTNLLRKRRSRRWFTDESLKRKHLSELLENAFGWLATRKPMPTLTVVRKSSPSGGCLHPTECYVLVMNVEGISPGYYHYNVAEHSLDLLRGLTCEEAVKDAQEIASGQYYFRSAAICLILATRFDRLFWKYSDHAKAYAASWADIGHISQTLYLLTTDMGIGMTFTAAISDANANVALGLDGVSQGSMAAIACGNVHPELRRNLEMTFTPRV
ncbi:hypothetical protein ASC97_29875 [Rhizobium sp. Root1203]|uniref:SagB family peptide dehydrogenase n=1 Tax=Rhizobium sp. Root1203 TaxID=1736427 RepID=UPI000714467B|nr:SagB family peptide dehydrogenase [Rhizobium sp. Root1203]KQV18268.1 hypothetical protein ASC97_29875 [Rhizobium sp. Root1203]